MRSSAGAKATACTRMSSLPYFSLSVAKRVSISLSLETSHWNPPGTGELVDEVFGFGAHALILVADGQGGSGCVEFLGDAPGDGTLVGQPEDHCRFACQIDHACVVPPVARLSCFPVAGVAKSRSFAYHPRTEKRSGPRSLRMTLPWNWEIYARFRIPSRCGGARAR